ncbi:ECF-type sigma factor [Marinicella litoralis]|uniref:RNA polymerase sigma factor (TIGR02999 family) n=1 Tax=Marinicella litoralis TaxID=644220 RepID=A0A4R6XRI1_9GAMM|nr:ECF-type sigma factor [Marinicella litoralis]TDR20507.1 RNA polymerase sigma factor (TIGR02999 family) [Marinicella litoralis]
MTLDTNLTEYILAYSDGDSVALDVIIEALYDQLKLAAAKQLNKLNPESISANDLVHEVYLKFSANQSFNANSRMHFMAIAATAMRQLIIDQLKAKKRQKRGGDLYATTLSDKKMPLNDNALEIISVNEALSKLRAIDPKLAQTVECRYFAGYTEQETAEALNVNVRTVRRYWSRSKRWLLLELSNE